MTTRSKFHLALDELKSKLLEMAGLAESAITNACDGYCRRDMLLCNRVFDLEKNINLAERNIDESAIDLLAMQQPMAIDLRFILAVLKINADLERVGDQAVNIAQRAIDLIEEGGDLQICVDVPRMQSAVTNMVRRALEAFLDGKAETAESVLELDNEVDKMKDDAFVTLVAEMQRDPAHVRQYLDALLVTRNLERIADHATNLAEDVIFWVRGDDVRHGARLQK